MKGREVLFLRSGGAMSPCGGEIEMELALGPEMPIVPE